MPWLVVVLVTVSVTIASALLSIHLEKRLNVLCVDVHKVTKPRVPCNGGFAIFSGLVTGTLLALLTGCVEAEVGEAVLLSLAIAFCIGLADDLVDLKSRWKILLGVLPALPILLLQMYTPRPWIPFAGFVRISRLYPLLLLTAFTVYQNGANMIDTHNGVLPVFTLSLHTFALVIKILTGSGIGEESTLLLLTFTVTILAYTPFNTYPARIFNGNTGAFVMGATVPLMLTLNRLEFYYALASAPMYINGFYYLASVKGFLQKESVKRPTYVDEKGCIHASRDPLAPITLVRLVTRSSNTGFSEKELVIVLYTLSILSSALASAIVFLLGYPS